MPSQVLNSLGYLDDDDEKLGEFIDADQQILKMVSCSAVDNGFKYLKLPILLILFIKHEPI